MQAKVQQVLNYPTLLEVNNKTACHSILLSRKSFSDYLVPIKVEARISTLNVFFVGNLNQTHRKWVVMM